MPSVLHTEKKSEQWPAGGEEKARIQPTIVEVLDESRRVEETKTEQLVHGALKVALIAAIIAGDFRRVYGWLGKVLAPGLPSNGRGFPAGKSHPSREVGCPHCGTRFVA